MKSSPSAETLSFAGVVFAGGQSRRMGRNKALLEIESVPLWQRQLQSLSGMSTGALYVSLRQGDDWLPAHVARIFDDGSRGPFGGLVAALEQTQTTHLIALAVDLPRMSSEWFERLKKQCSASRGAIGRNVDVDAYEPLAAIYPRETLAFAREAAAAGNYCLQTLITRLVEAGRIHVEPISAPERPWFTNWNTPADVREV